MKTEPSAEAQATIATAATTATSDLKSHTQRKQVLLRLDPKVHAALAKWASDDLRSVNAQIEVLLRRALLESGRGVNARPIPPRGRPPKQ